MFYHVHCDVVVGDHDARPDHHEQEPVDEKLEQGALGRETPQVALEASGHGRFVFAFGDFRRNVDSVG